MNEPDDVLDRALGVLSADDARADDIKAAAELCWQILKQQAEHPEALHVLAVALDRQGRHRHADKLRRNALAAGRVRQGDLLQAMGRRDEAVDAYRSALRFDRYNRRACDRLGSYFRIGTEAVPERFGKPPLGVYRTPIGTYCLLSDAPGDFVMLRMKAGMVFEEEIVAAVAPHVRPGSTVVDVGANFGQMSLCFSDLVGDGGHVLAVEADPFVHHVLTRNIEVNGRSNVRAVQAAAHERAGERLFLDAQDFELFSSYGSYGIDPAAASGLAVETVTVDGLDPPAPVSAIKVDVQGSDLFALRGARGTIARDRPAVIFEFEEQFQEKFGTSLQDYMGFVDEIGYRVEAVIGGMNYLVLPR